MKKTFSFGHSSSCCDREPVFGTPYKKDIRGLNDVVKIAKVLKGMDYDIDEKNVLMDVGGYEDVTLKQMTKFGIKEEPSSYRLTGDGISIGIKNFCYSKNPGYIGSGSVSGVRGFIEIFDPKNKQNDFEKIKRVIESFLAEKHGWHAHKHRDSERKIIDYYDIRIQKEKNDPLHGFFDNLIIIDERGRKSKYKSPEKPEPVLPFFEAYPDNPEKPIKLVSPFA